MLGMQTQTSHKPKPTWAWLAVLMLPCMLVLTGCGSEIIPHGNALDEALLQRVKVGSTRRAEIEALFGRPSVTGAFDSGTIYYVAQVMKQAPAGRKSTLSRDVIAFHFDAEDVLTGMDRLSADDGADVSHFDAKTPTPGQRLGVFEQILRNLRRVNTRPPGQN